MLRASPGYNFTSSYKKSVINSMHLFEYEIFKVLKKWKFLLIAVYSQIWIIQLCAHWDTCVTITLLYITNYWINPVWLPFGYHLEGKTGGKPKADSCKRGRGSTKCGCPQWKKLFSFSCHYFEIISVQ